MLTHVDETLILGALSCEARELLQCKPEVVGELAGVIVGYMLGKVLPLYQAVEVVRCLQYKYM